MIWFLPFKIRVWIYRRRARKLEGERILKRGWVTEQNRPKTERPYPLLGV